MALSYYKDDSVAKVVMEKSFMLQEDFERSTLFPTMGGNPRIRQAFALPSNTYTKSRWSKANSLRGHQHSSVPLHLYWRHTLHYCCSIALCSTRATDLLSKKHNNQTPFWRTGLEDFTCPYRKMYLRGVGQVCATGFFYHINNLKHFCCNSWSLGSHTGSGETPIQI